MWVFPCWLLQEDVVSMGSSWCLEAKASKDLLVLGLEHRDRALELGLRLEKTGPDASHCWKKTQPMATAHTL